MDLEKAIEAAKTAVAHDLGYSGAEGVEDDWSAIEAGVRAAAPLIEQAARRAASAALRDDERFRRWELAQVEPRTHLGLMHRLVAADYLESGDE